MPQFPLSFPLPISFVISFTNFLCHFLYQFPLSFPLPISFILCFPRFPWLIFHFRSVKIFWSLTTENLPFSSFFKIKLFSLIPEEFEFLTQIFLQAPHPRFSQPKGRGHCPGDGAEIAPQYCHQQYRNRN